jgi:hypothetical protein
VFLSPLSIGVPVKPMNDALGSASRMCLGETIDEIVLAAVRFIGDDANVAP